MSVGTHQPDDTSTYTALVQDGLHIYYSPRLDRVSQTLELDYTRAIFRSKPLLSGPEELVAAVLMGRF